MTTLPVYLLIPAFIVWVIGADLTVCGIEKFRQLSHPWYRLPRLIRTFLALFAWPLLSGIAFVILVRDRHD